jgi:hypothetical protein
MVLLLVLLGKTLSMELTLLNLWLNLLTVEVIFVLISVTIVVLLVLKLVVVLNLVIPFSLIILVNLSGMIVYLIMDKILFTNVVLLLNQ